MRVLKIGGTLLDQPSNLAALAESLRAVEEPLVIVHGGGKEIDQLQARLGIEAVKLMGLRKTDAESLGVVLMVLCGSVNKKLVAALMASGRDAIGLSGVDGGLLRCQKLAHPAGDLGQVGEIVSVRRDLLSQLLTEGFTPVVAPVSLGMDGLVYNVNADQAATAIASALQAEVLDFLSDVPGVMVEGRILAHMTAEQAQSLISSGAIAGGMVPKVNAALEALNEDILSVRILGLSELENSGGTLIVRQALDPADPNQVRNQ